MSGELNHKLIKFSWCEENHTFLQSPPHPSPLPYHLRRSVFLRLPPQEAILYARKYLLAYIPSQEVLKLLTSTLYTGKANGRIVPNDTVSLVQLFREEFCKRHGWPKEDPLEVVVDLGSRGGALNAIEKARRVMGAHLGDVRKWDELPVCLVCLPYQSTYSTFKDLLLTIIFLL